MVCIDTLCCTYQATAEEVEKEKKRKTAATAAKKKSSPPTQKTPAPGGSKNQPDVTITPEKPPPQKNRDSQVLDGETAVPVAPRRLTYKTPDPDQAKQIESLQKAPLLVF